MVVMSPAKSNGALVGRARTELFTPDPNMTYLLNVDALLMHLDFLRRADQAPRILSRPERMRQAARRYEACWLPLLAARGKVGEEEVPEESLAPPLDVHVAWHCHMLCPTLYAKDLRLSSTLGRMARHRNRPQEEWDKMRERCKGAWEETFPEEPFQPPWMTQEGDTIPETDFESAFEYDLVAAAERQSSFYYQVSLPHYRERGFLNEALKRYSNFLRLKKQHPGEFLAPCYDVDLAWHAHQVCPEEYARDTSAYLGGRVLPHDDTVNDRSPGSRLCNAQDRTEELWRGAAGTVE